MPLAVRCSVPSNPAPPQDVAKVEVDHRRFVDWWQAASPKGNAAKRPTRKPREWTTIHLSHFCTKVQVSSARLCEHSSVTLLTPPQPETLGTKRVMRVLGRRSERSFGSVHSEYTAVSLLEDEAAIQRFF